MGSQLSLFTATSVDALRGQNLQSTSKVEGRKPYQTQSAEGRHLWRWNDLATASSYLRIALKWERTGKRLEICWD